MNVTLRLVYTDAPQRPAGAWFVAGESAASWLDELARWSAPLAEARLYVISQPQTRECPCGVLVVGAAPPGPAHSARVFPYGLAGARLYLPIEARLDPAVSDGELDELTGDTPYVWHPQAGLVALDPEFAVRVADLLEPPGQSATRWDAAVPGVALQARLLSIEPEAALSFQDVLQGGREDIGTQASALDRLPPAPDEPAAGSGGDFWRQVNNGLAGAIRWFAKQLPHTGSRRNWINELEDWAERRLRQLAQSDEGARHREILRLLKLLQTDPEAGLRFALPFASEPHRGLAEPSNRLAERNVDFDLQSLSGGRPADFWNLPDRYRTQLTQRYRELAARELALGRYRRAAYIFAALLGDFTSAAAALSSGQHWREAAVLYDERLKQPAEAARCLRAGGFWTEAIALYERLGQHETVGDLYQQLDRNDEATAAWRQAVRARLTEHDRLSAARILEHKLAVPEEALKRLVNAWPASHQAQPCLAAAFSLLARHAWHDQALVLAGDLASSTPVPSRPRLVDELVRQAQAYPQADVRRLAADQARVVTANLLETADVRQSEELVRVISRLVPEDRLLSRDAERFVAARSRRQRATREWPAGKSTAKLTTEFQIQLPAWDWKAAVAVPGGLVAAGYCGRELVVLRMAWADGSVEELPGQLWKVEPRQVGSPILLACDDLEPRSLFIHILGQSPPSVFRGFAKSSRFPGTLTVSSNAGLSAAGMAMLCSAAGWNYVVNYHDDGALVISTLLPPDQGEMIGLVSLGPEELLPVENSLRLPLPLVVREGKIFLGFGRRLFVIAPGARGPAASLELPGVITHLAASAPHTRTRIAIALEEGGLVLWGDTIKAPQTPFASGMPEPKIALTRGGRLIAAGPECLEIYNAREGQVRIHAGGAHGVGEPLAVLPAAHVNQFAVIGTDGRVQVSRIDD